MSSECWELGEHLRDLSAAAPRAQVTIIERAPTNPRSETEQAEFHTHVSGLPVRVVFSESRERDFAAELTVDPVELDLALYGRFPWTTSSLPTTGTLPSPERPYRWIYEYPFSDK